jgi:hypothetical protein
MQWNKAFSRATACLVLGSAASSASANDFAISVVFDGAVGYVWSVSIDDAPAQENPPLLLIRGETYTFHVTGLAGFHSFYINTFNTTGSVGKYTGGGLSNNGFNTDTPVGSPVTFTVPQSAPDTLWYNCGLHFTMAGMITVDGVFRNGFETQ